MEVEVRLRRVRRWLDRLSRAVDLSMWESAVAESQCLEAEARSLRETLCGSAGSFPARYAARPVAVGVALALAILLAAGEPVSLGDLASRTADVAVDGVTLAPGDVRPTVASKPSPVAGDHVAREGRKDLDDLPKVMPPVSSVRPAAAEVVDTAGPGKAVADSRARRRDRQRVEVVPSIPPASKVKVSTGDVVPPLEEALMLLRAGQRALEGQ